MIGRGMCLASRVGEYRVHQSVGSVRVGLEVGLAAVGAQLGAGGGADRGELRPVQRLRAGRVEEMPDRRGRGERDVVGARDGLRSRRRRAARARSRRARARRRGRRARAGRRGGRRDPPCRARSGRARTSTPASASTIPSATERCGHDVGLDAVLPEGACGAGAHRRHGHAGQAAGVADAAEQLAHAVRARGDQEVVAGRGPAPRRAATRCGWRAPRSRRRRARAGGRRAGSPARAPA